MIELVFTQLYTHDGLIDRIEARFAVVKTHYFLIAN